MKLIILLQTFLFIALHANAVDMTPLSGAFKIGNASTLVSYLDTEVDMAVLGSTSKCNAGKAVEMLNTFFSSNTPSSFNIVHNADKKDTGFIVGKLATSKGEYRVNVSYRSDGNKAIIQSIRIE